MIVMSVLSLAAVGFVFILCLCSSLHLLLLPTKTAVLFALVLEDFVEDIMWCS